MGFDTIEINVVFNVFSKPYWLFSDVCPDLVVAVPACRQNNTGIDGVHEEITDEVPKVLEEKQKMGSF